MSIFSRGLEIGSDKLRAVNTMLFRQNRGEARTIACGDIKLYIDYEGNTKLYFKDRELCKSRGIDSLILFDGRWYELNGARKTVNKVSENKLLLSADFKDISFIQRWCFELNHDNTLCINVENESKNGLRADMLRVWLSLDKRYENWFNEDALKYEFPGFTQSWQAYYQSERIDFLALNADEPDMPALIFKAQGDADIFFLKNTATRRASLPIGARPWSMPKYWPVSPMKSAWKSTCFLATAKPKTSAPKPEIILWPMLLKL